MIEICESGPFNTVQDLGRPGYRDIGVSASGAMDPFAVRIGNVLVGNDENAAVIEVQTFPFSLRFERRTVFAVTGADSHINLDGSDLIPWCAYTAEPGQVLQLQQPPRLARSYIAVGGGLDIPVVMLSNQLRIDAFGKRVRVTEICPGRVATDIFNHVHGNDPSIREKFIDGFELPEATDIADAIAFAIAAPVAVNIGHMEITPTLQVMLNFGNSSYSRPSRNNSFRFRDATISRPSLRQVCTARRPIPTSCPTIPPRISPPGPLFASPKTTCAVVLPADRTICEREDCLYCCRRAAHQVNG